MTEAEWLALDDVLLLSRDNRLVSLSRRSAVLFGAACIRAAPGLAEQNCLRAAVAEAEKAADTGGWDGLTSIHCEAEAACRKAEQWSAAHYWSLSAFWLTHDNVENRWLYFADFLYHAAASGTTIQNLRVTFAVLLRDIFGNPFRPVTFSPVWRTDTAVALARQMYESRDFSAMPILADALQDVGCDNEDILSHCRDPKATHVRGCWVVDLVLGKE
jgi:hypothetical protein